MPPVLLLYYVSTVTNPGHRKAPRSTLLFHFSPPNTSKTHIQDIVSNDDTINCSSYTVTINTVQLSHCKHTTPIPLPVAFHQRAPLRNHWSAFELLIWIRLAYWLNGLRMGDEHSAYAPLKYGTFNYSHCPWCFWCPHSLFLLCCISPKFAVTNSLLLPPTSCLHLPLSSVLTHTTILHHLPCNSAILVAI